MSSEIKFRAWDNVRKVMLVQSPIMSYALFTITPDGLVYEKGVLQGLELMQFTGLLDKNGKEIYEGDIVEIETLNDPEIFEVVFHEGSYCLKMPEGLFPISEYLNQAPEVIGNRYEDADLIDLIQTA